MKNLFYSTQDKNLFWVAGYTWNENTSNALEEVNLILLLLTFNY